MQTTETAHLIPAINSLLARHGWTPRWANWNNAMVDAYGNAFSITEDDETLRVEFEYALPGGCVETLHLSVEHGAHRIAAVITALAAPPVV